MPGSKPESRQLKKVSQGYPSPVKEVAKKGDLFFVATVGRTKGSSDPHVHLRDPGMRFRI